MPLNYIGSKHSLLEFLDDVFRTVAEGGERVFCDLFAGTGAVGRFFKRQGMQVYANDIQYYSYAVNRAYIGICHPPAFAELRAAQPEAASPGSGLFGDPVNGVLGYLNNIAGYDGFVTRNYSPRGGRQFFTVENASRIDSIRALIADWHAASAISDDEYFYILCALLEAADSIANTASVYGAFLKKFKPSALRRLNLRPLHLTNSVEPGLVYNEDANALVRRLDVDILYIDPPYNHRQYGANYHVLETIARYDEPVVTGVSGLRPYYRSAYCQTRNVGDAFRDLIVNARAKHILVSYNNEGLVCVDDLLKILALRGTPRTFSTSYARYKADSGREYKHNNTVEYVHYVRVVK